VSRPPRLRDGETIGIAATAGPVPADRLANGLARLGDRFRIRVAPSITAPRDPDVPAYLSASDDVRVDEFHAMLADPEIRAIILPRGGYGIMRILPRLDADLLRRDPKPIVGFSDATALLAWAHAAGVRGIHGPMIGQLGTLSDADVARLVTLLTDPSPPGVRPWSLTSHGCGIHRGPLVTANLTLASMLVGSRWPLPLAGAIAMFEDIGERPYEIDRYLTQLALTGATTDTAAFVMADFTNSDGAVATVIERLRDRPLAIGAPVGHGERNEAVPFGAPAILDLDAGTLEILEGAVL
jgi:muramoyltetrapeptide carboxypeptidase